VSVSTQEGADAWPGDWLREAGGGGRTMGTTIVIGRAPCGEERTQHEHTILLYIYPTVEWGKRTWAS
jgi:hypothetical protein